MGFGGKSGIGLGFEQADQGLAGVVGFSAAVVDAPQAGQGCGLCFGIASAIQGCLVFRKRGWPIAQEGCLVAPREGGIRNGDVW
jgi:hypothetical protein